MIHITSQALPTTSTIAIKNFSVITLKMRRTIMKTTTMTTTRSSSSRFFLSGMLLLLLLLASNPLHAFRSTPLSVSRKTSFLAAPRVVKQAPRRTSSSTGLSMFMGSDGGLLGVGTPEVVRCFMYCRLFLLSFVAIVVVFVARGSVKLSSDKMENVSFHWICRNKKRTQYLMWFECD